MDQVVVGDPTDPETDLGSLITHAHRDKVAGFVDRARAAGARVLAGGVAPDGDLAAGAFYRPTLIVDAAQDREIVQQEVFGPVLIALPFDTDDEAIALANDTPVRARGLGVDDEPDALAARERGDRRPGACG